jgi:hypothetical protein
MKTHKFNPNMSPDELYQAGKLKYLVPGNECRFLDKRRTPGIIRFVDLESGFFQWEITEFEDIGKIWEVEFEGIGRYQFFKNCSVLNSIDLSSIEKRVAELNREIKVTFSQKDFERSQTEINSKQDWSRKWLQNHSEFFESATRLDFEELKGSQALRNDFNSYMESIDLKEVDIYTTKNQVLNPFSGDWIKAVQISLAEMGFKNYHGKSIRSEKIYERISSKEKLKSYIQYRIAFIREVFSHFGLHEVVLYRGMSSETGWKTNLEKDSRFWSSWTFSYKVAQDFSEITPNSNHKNSYIIKRSIPVEKLFMTYLETDAMNDQYLEAEAIVLHTDEDRLLW